MSRAARLTLTWAGSLAAAALLLPLAGRHLDLWPDGLHFADPLAFVGACLLWIPYVWLRSHRLAIVLDPLYAHATDVPGDRVPRAVLHGSGLLSFFAVLLLPLRLGELSRPILLARARLPGISLSSAIAAIAAERVLDGLIVVGMLFLGLAATVPANVDPEIQEAVRRGGLSMAVMFAVAAALLLAHARAPEYLSGVATRLPGPWGPRLSAALAAAAAALSPVWSTGVGGRLTAVSAVYWAVTVLQSWLVMRAVGLELGAMAAIATVAIIGLSIQLPGGPAQLGNFQVGAGIALVMCVGPEPTAEGSSFAALAYLLSIAGTTAAAVVGASCLAAFAGPAVPQVSSPRT